MQNKFYNKKILVYLNYMLSIDFIAYLRAWKILLSLPPLTRNR